MSNVQHVVTVLEVDSRPAEAGADRYEAAMQKLARASEQAAERQERARQAAERAAGGLQLVPQATDRATAAMARLQAATDPVARMTQAFERATNQAATAVRGGAASYDQASAALDRLRTKQQQQLATLQNVGKASQASADTLRMSYDTAYANAARYGEVEQQVAQHVAARTLTIEQGNTILAGAGVRFRQMGQQAGAANENIRLTSHQMTNLGYQTNDVLTMFAMGASPFQIISSQAGQVVQALGDGPQGVSGSLRAIGGSIMNFARAIPTAAYAVAGLTAAVAGVYALTRGSAARSAEESVASFEAAVKSLEGAWGGAGDAAEAYYERATRQAAANPAAAMLDTQAELRKLQQDYRNAVRDLNWNDTLSERIIAPDMGGMSEARLEIRALYTQLMAGEIKASEMAAAMLRIRLDPEVEGYTRTFADQIRIALNFATDLQARMEGVGKAVEGLAGKGARVFGNPDQSAPWDLGARFGGGVTEPFGRINPEGLDAIRDGLREQREALTEADNAANEYAKSLEAMRSGWTDSASDLRMQVEMFGRSAGAIASARFEHEALAEARQLAADADKVFDENGADAARIREVAGEVGTLTDRLKALGETQAQTKRVSDALADLQFQGSIIGLPDLDREVATTLRQLKLETGSFDAQRIEGQIRYNASLTKTHEQLDRQRELMSNIMSTGFDTLFDTSDADSFFDRVTKGLAPVGRQFTNDLSALFQEDAG